MGPCTANARRPTSTIPQVNSCLCSAGKECVHRAVSVITDIVDSLGTDGVSRSKQLCYTSLSDHIDTASQLLTVYMHHRQPGKLTASFTLALSASSHQHVCDYLSEWLYIGYGYPTHFPGLFRHGTRMGWGTGTTSCI